MRTARPPPLQNPKRGPHGGLRVHRRLVQPPSPPFRPRLSFTDQLRKDSANRKFNRKPNTVHRNGVAPLIERRDLFASSRKEMELVDVRSIEVSRSLLQRLLGLGTVAVASAASAEFLIIMSDIRDPQHVADTVRQARLKRLS